MKSKESHSIRNSVIASVVSGMFLSFWPPFMDFLEQAFLFIWGVVETIWEWILSPHSIYGWMLVIAILLGLPTLVRLFFEVTQREEGFEDLYKSDLLFGAKWSWSYVNGAITHLWCLCPSCNGELVYAEFIPDRYNFEHQGLEPKTDFICDRCGGSKCSLKGRKVYALASVEREIRRKIRNGDWVAKV